MPARKATTQTQECHPNEGCAARRLLFDSGVCGRGSVAFPEVPSRERVQRHAPAVVSFRAVSFEIVALAWAAPTKPEGSLCVLCELIGSFWS